MENGERAKTLCRVALWCAQYTAKLRPSMNDVVMMLENKIPVGMPPYPFQFGQSPGSSMPTSLQAIPEVDSNLSSDTDERFKKTKGEKEEAAVEDGNFDSASKNFASSSTSRQPPRSTPEQNTSAQFTDNFFQSQNHYQHSNEGVKFNPNQFHNAYSTVGNQAQGRILEGLHKLEVETARNDKC